VPTHAIILGARPRQGCAAPPPAPLTQPPLRGRGIDVGTEGVWAVLWGHRWTMISHALHARRWASARSTADIISCARIDALSDRRSQRRPRERSRRKTALHVAYQGRFAVRLGKELAEKCVRRAYGAWEAADDETKSGGLRRAARMHDASPCSCRGREERTPRSDALLVRALADKRLQERGDFSLNVDDLLSLAQIFL
jgi:hypothetical protein